DYAPPQNFPSLTVPPPAPIAVPLPSLRNHRRRRRRAKPAPFRTARTPRHLPDRRRFRIQHLQQRAQTQRMAPPPRAARRLRNPRLRFRERLRPYTFSGSHRPNPPPRSASRPLPRFCPNSAATSTRHHDQTLLSAPGSPTSQRDFFPSRPRQSLCQRSPKRPPQLQLRFHSTGHDRRQLPRSSPPVQRKPAHRSHQSPSLQRRRHSRRSRLRHPPPPPPLPPPPAASPPRLNTKFAPPLYFPPNPILCAQKPKI